MGDFRIRVSALEQERSDETICKQRLLVLFLLLSDFIIDIYRCACASVKDPYTERETQDEVPALESD